MMVNVLKNNEQVYYFLKAKNFELFKEHTSEFFGDYYDILSNGSFQLRFSSSKSVQTVDIRKNLPNEDWYDLALVRALLYNEKNLTNVIDIEEYIDFLQKEFPNIEQHFTDNHYPAAKRILEELGNERAKQMFPKAKNSQKPGRKL